MKKIFLAIAIIFVSLNCIGQYPSSAVPEKVVSYYTTTIHNKTHKFNVESTLIDRNKEFKYYIGAIPLDNWYGEGGFIIRSKNLDEFINATITAKEKFVEWSKIAKNNNVKNYVKNMNLYSLIGCYYGNNGNFNFEYNKIPIFTFYVDENGKCYLMIGVDDVGCESVFITFSNEKDIDDFIGAISPLFAWAFFNDEVEKARIVVEEKRKTDSLFE